MGRLRVGQAPTRAAKYGVVGVTNVSIDFALYALLVSLGDVGKTIRDACGEQHGP